MTAISLMKGVFEIVRLDLLGIHILPIAEDDHFLLAPGEKQMSLGVEVSEVAGKKPAVAHHGISGIRTVPIALHHYRAAHRDFADCRALFLLAEDR